MQQRGIDMAVVRQVLCDESVGKETIISTSMFRRLDAAQQEGTLPMREGMWSYIETVGDLLSLSQSES